MSNIHVLISTTLHCRETPACYGGWSFDVLQCAGSWVNRWLLCQWANSASDKLQPPFSTFQPISTTFVNCSAWKLSSKVSTTFLLSHTHSPPSAATLWSRACKICPPFFHSSSTLTFYVAHVSFILVLFKENTYWVILDC